MKRQQGVALLMVLMIFAFVSLLATAMIDRESTDIQRASTLLDIQRARAYAQGAEDAVRTGLYLDWKQDGSIDHLNEEWAQERTLPLDPDPGRVLLKIADAQGRFNLNSMQPTASSNDVQLQRFRNLLNQLGLDPLLASYWQRWLSADSQADELYLSREQHPYRAAYRACTHTSELMLIEGMTREAYKRLEPYIACLPITVTLNVNTASAVVLAALDERLSLADGQALVAERGEKGFASVDDFWGSSVVTRFTQEPDSERRNNNGNNDDNVPSTTRWDKAAFDVKSEYFEMFARVEFAGRIATLEALLQRTNSDGSLNTLYRNFSRREARPQEAPGLSLSVNNRN
jgi:general secretion pathway protein K